MHELDRIRLALADAANRGEGAVLATVVGVDGSTYRGAGALMVVRADGSTVGAVSGGCLEADIVARAAERLAAGTPELVHYDTRTSDDGVFGLGMGCQGVIDVRLEPLSRRSAARRDRASSPSCAREAAVRTARLRCGQRRDPRRPFRGDGRLARHRRRSPAELRERGAIPRRGACDPPRRVQPDSALASAVRLDTFTAAVVMGHAAAHDRARLHELLAGTSLRYIGVLGPRRRTMELLEGAPGVAAGVIPPNVYAPVGLDIGAETPDEIALAIVSECAAALAGRPPRSLRDRGGAIHEERR